MTIFEAQYIHFIGIGGIGTSSLAQILITHNKKISGSDLTDTAITKTLKKKGIPISIGHKRSNIKKTHQLIIYSPAIPKNNPELKQAKFYKITSISYPRALGQLSKKYYTIAIAGTHGKSTTTALTALTLINGNLDPTVVIGTKLKEFKNRNYRVGESNFLVLEACEYRRSFLHLKPNILIITNLEAEHLDYYKNLQNYKKAFQELCQKVPGNGTIIINKDDKNSFEVVKNSQAKVCLWSSKDKKSDFYLDLKEHYLHLKNLKIKLEPSIPGEFNLKNAAFAALAAALLKIPLLSIRKTIKSYKGSWRRLQYKKTKLSGTIFIDDYAHHPTEVRVTLAAIREKYPQQKILCVFQPHQYSRTYLLLEQFSKSFNNVDELVIPNIYKVRDSEQDLEKISTEKLVKHIKKHTPQTKNGKSLEKTAIYIKKNYRKFDVIVTMGAGDISQIYKLL